MSQVYSGLEFMTTGTFSTSNGVVSSTSPVQVGIKPAGGAVFSPLLQLDNGVQFTPSNSSGTFTTNGTVSAFSGGQTVPFLDGHMHSFTASSLLGSRYFTLASGDTNAAQLSVAGGSLAVTGLHFNGPELDLQGSLTLPKLQGLTLAVQGNDHIAITSSGIQLTGADIMVPGPTTFTKSGLTITTQNLDVHYSAATNEFDVSGSASVTVAGNTLSLALGTTTTPGLVIVNGDLQSLLATVTPPVGNSDTPFKIKGVSFALNSATFSYDRSTSSFGIGADATFSEDDQMVNLTIGSAGMPGIIIQSGQLTTLDAAITSDIKVAGLKIKTEDLAIHYDAGQDLMISGKASLAFKGQNIELALGSKDSDNIMHPGISIDPNTGTLVSLDAAITSDIKVGDLTFKTEDLSIHYSSGDSTLAITGKASFDLKNKGGMTPDQTVAVTLGAGDKPGLVIDAMTGNLISLDASITADITIDGFEIKADNLAFHYDSSNTFAISGSATFKLDDNTVSIILGANGTPGLVIRNGQLVSLEAAVSGEIDVKGIKITADNLTVSYVAATDATQESFAIFGSVAVKTSFLNFDAMLGTDIQSAGIVIANGQLQSLNITVSGGFSLFGITVAANGLTIQYSSSAHSLELSGGIMVELNSDIKASASITQGGLLIDTQTGALSLDTAHGLEVKADVEFGAFAIHNLDIAYSMGVGGINFHASGEVDFPGGYAIGLTNLTIQNGQLVDIGLHLAGKIEIGDTGVFLDSFDGSLMNLTTSPAVSASVTLSIGPEIDIPSIPGIYTSTGPVAIVLATGSISVDANHLDLSGSVQLAGGLLGDGSASIDINWSTGVYSVSVDHIGIYDNAINFSGSLTLDNQGDVTLQAMASLNVPSIVPFIGGTQLGSGSLYLQVRPADPNLADSYFAAWTSINLFVTSYTVGFKVDFTGAFTVLDGDGVAAIQQMAAASTQQQAQQPVTYHYTQTISNSDSQAAGYQVKVSTPAFQNNAYPTVFHFDRIGPAYVNGPSAGNYYAIYNLSDYAIQNSISFTVYDAGGTAIDSGIANPNGTFTIGPIDGSKTVPTGAILNGAALELLWAYNPGPISISVSYETPKATLQILQHTSSGYQLVRSVNIDPLATQDPNAAMTDNIPTDRLLYINAATDVISGGDPGQYQVDLVTTGTPLGQNAMPMFTETTRYPAPAVTNLGGVPALSSAGVLSGSLYAISYTPEAQQAGDTSTKVSLYYTLVNPGALNQTSNPTDAADIAKIIAHGTPIASWNYSNLKNINPNNPALGKSLPFTWEGFQNLPAGSYYVYAVISDGQSPPQYSPISGPYTAASPTPVLSGPAFLPLSVKGGIVQPGVFNAATQTALGVTTSFVNPVTIQLSLGGGGNLILPGGTASPSLTLGYPSSAAAAVALDGLQFVPDSTFTSAANLTYTVSSTIPGDTVGSATVTDGGSGYQSAPTVTFSSIDGKGSGARGIAILQNGQVVGITIQNLGSGYDAPPQVIFSGGNPTTPAAATATLGITYTATRTIPLLVPNMHLLVTQTVDTTTPSNPDDAIITVSVSNPGGPNGQNGTGVMVQNYLSKGLTILSSSASQGSFDPTTGLWNIGNLPISTGNNPVTLTLTVQADSSTYDKLLTNMADATSDLPPYPDKDVQSVVTITPQSHAIVIGPGTLSPGAIQSPYYEQMTADRGGGGPYTFTLSSGSLPPGFSLTAGGLLSGLASKAGTFTFSVIVSNPAGVSTTVPMQIAVANTPLAITGTPYNAPIGFAGLSSYSLQSGSLPPGLSLTTSASGVVALTGTPITPGYYTFVIRNTYLFGGYGDTNISLFVDQAVSLSPATLPVALAGTSYSQALTLTGGSGGNTFGQFGGQLPPGLTLSLNGVVSGTIPATATPGIYTFTVFASNGVGDSVTQTEALQVYPPIGVASQTLPPATIIFPYQGTIGVVTGGSGTGYTFAVTGGALPAGLTLAPNGQLSGTIPTGTPVGNDFLTITVTDSVGNSQSLPFTLQVNPPIMISPAVLPDGAASAVYLQKLTATGGSIPLYGFQLTGGALPAGLSLGLDGTISGTIAPSARSGYYSFTVTATDPAMEFASVTCTLFVDAAMTISSGTLPAAQVNTSYSQTLKATGGSGIYTFTLTGGSLPAGLTLSVGGVLSGTLPTSTPAGISNFLVTETDSLGMTCSNSYSLMVDPLNVTWTGKISNAWSNPANWSPQIVPSAGANVTIPAGTRLPVLDTATVVYNLALKPGSNLTLAGHALTTYGTFTNQGTLILQGNEPVSLANGNDTTEGTWLFSGDGKGSVLTLADFGTADYFNLTITDTHTHPDTFQTATDLTIQGMLNLTAGTFTLSGGSLTTAGLTLSGTGVLNAPGLLNDSGNWTVTSGTFNPSNGTVAFTGRGTQQLQSGNRPFANVTHTGTGTLTLASAPILVKGSLTLMAGTFDANGKTTTVSGQTTINGGTYLAGAAAQTLGALVLINGTFTGSRGTVNAGSVTISGGTFTAPSLLNDSGNWTNTAGTFIANRGNVALTGSNQHISGSTTFFNLSKTPFAADTLTFQAGATQTILGTLTLKGSASKLLALRSSASGTAWDLDPLGSAMLSYLDVMDGKNVSSRPITAIHSHNSGNNTGFNFPPG